MLNYEFPPLGGGAGRACFNILKEFAKRDDIEIILITSSSDVYREEDFSKNIKIYFLNIGKKDKLLEQSNLDLLFYSWKAYWLTKKLKKIIKFDLVHAFFGVPCGYLALKLKLPYIISLRGADVPGHSPKYGFIYFLLNKIIRNTWKNSQALIANSHDLKNEALKFYDLKNIEIIGNGVENKIFFPSDINKDGVFRVLFVGRFDKIKGLEYLVRAFHVFSKDKNATELVLVGDGKLFNKIKKMAMQDKIKFLGNLKQKELVDIYQKSSVFVLPSLSEGMSNTLLEAMSCGLAAVATDTGSAKTILNGGGLIVKKKNENDIARALNELYDNPGLLKKMQERNYLFSAEKTWDKISDKYFEIYLNCISYE